MGVEIKLDMQAIRGLEQAAVKAAKTAMEQVAADVTNTVPLDQGDLQNSIYVDTRKNGDEWHIFLDHGMLYARYLYFGNLMVDPYTGSAWAGEGVKKGVLVPHQKLKFKNGRTDHWLEPYISGNKKDFVKNKFAEEFKKESGV